MQTMRQFVQKYHVRAAAQWADPDPEEYAAYKVVLRRPGKQMTVPMQMGIAHTHAPTAEEVLNNLASSAGGYDQSSGFHDWASEYGLDYEGEDEESKHRATYNAVKEQTEKLQQFLGGDLYEELLYRTQGL